MAFDIDEIGGYGTAKLGDVEISEGTLETLNSYARIRAIDELDDYKIVIDSDSAIIGTYENFVAGNEVLVHVSSSPQETEYLGRYLVAKILLVGNGILTLDKKVTDIMPRDKFSFYSMQVVTFANFDCLTLKKTGAIMPPIYDPYKFCGGIVTLKCWDSLNFEGGHINLSECGIPANRKTFLRPLTEQETAANGEGDFAKFSGQENFITAGKFLLNAGDGAAFIVAKNIYGNADSRIGNVETHGAAFCRGAENSVGVKPSNVTNKGGSTIFIAADNFYNFNPKMIAKYRDAKLFEGAGLCRCYIATNTTLPNDEGLYSYDVIDNPQRLKLLNINDFGDGKFGDIVNPKKPINNYARVTSISQGNCRLTISNETTNGLAPIETGAKILLQVIQKTNHFVEDAGKILVAKILSRVQDVIVIDIPAPKIDLTNYVLQVVSIPQFENFTLNENYTATPKFNGNVGGVLAFMVNGVCDISSGKLNVEDKGGAVAYGSNGLKFIGNAQMCDKLPLGEGHGSIFIVAKTLTLNDTSRIGARYSGEGTGNRLGGNNSSGTNLGGGYSGSFDEDGQGSAGGYIGGGASTENDVGGIGGSGACGGTYENYSELDRSKVSGGYGSNGKNFGKYAGGRQGAHIFVAAGKINNFSQKVFSTGGGGGQGKLNGAGGAAGYGGGAAYGGSSGGSSGFCFIYTSEV